MKFGKLIGAIVFAVSLYVLWQIRQVLLLGFTAVAFATVLNRPVRWLERHHVKRPFGVLITVLSVLALLGGIVAFIVPSFMSEWEQLVELVPEGLNRLRSWYQWLQNLIPGQLLTDIGGLKDIYSELMESDSGAFSGFLKVFSNSLDFILNLLLVVVLIVMMLSSPHPYRNAFTLLFPSFYRPRIDDILDECETKLVGWTTGMFFNMAVIGCFSSIGLWILGIRLPIVNGIIAALLTWIPNIGPVTSTIPPTALALLDTPWKALAVIGLYIVIQQIESNILTPLVMEHQVSLLPAVTLISQVAFAVFFGLFGLFLALPLLVVLQVWIRELLIEDILNSWQARQERKARQKGDRPPEDPKPENA